MGPAPPRTLRRQAARAVVLDGEDRVLLLQACDPLDRSKGEWWEIPGGGMDPGETSAQAAARELLEETGMDGVELGGCVWRQHSRFVFAGIHFDQDEQIHVGRVLRVVSDGWRPAGLESLEAAAFKGQRWWPLDDLDALVAAGGRVIPAWLPAQLRQYLADGPPRTPVDISS